jgi:prephenate dehydrogenase
MRNREAALKKIDQIDSSLKKLISFLRRGDEQSFNDTLEGMNEQIDQLRTYIDSEPIVGYEMNSSAQ